VRVGDSIIDLLSQGRDREAQASKVYGLVVGLVTNNKDPQKWGRVKVKFPWLADDVESHWARVCQPMAGKQRGQWWIPEIDDEVLCGFEHGDVRFPYVVGSLYNGVDTPPQCNDITGRFGGTGYDHGAYSCSNGDFNQDGANNLRFMRSRSGHLIILDDTDGKEKITIADKTGQHRLEVFTDKKKLVITSADGDIELIADKKILMRCENLQIETRQKTTIDAKDNIEAKSQKQVQVESSMNSSYKAGMSMTIEATAQMDIKAGPAISASAGVIKLN
jgi:uncharacterized protein involved in type VI secretion and phage assembly